MDGVRLDGKTAIVTGASAGIGVETARELSRRGARVILACRDEIKANAVCDLIKDSTENNDVIVRLLDLASLESIRRFADDFNKDEARLDLLVNNAGVLTKERKETLDGFEMIFGVNHLGHFYLTNLLLEKLKSSAPSRIVNVSSMGHRMSSVNFSDLQQERTWFGFSPMKAYGQSKSANILFTVHLAKLLGGTGVSVYSLHPGVIKTEIGRDYDENSWSSRINRFAVWISGQKWLTPEQGAATTLYCCLEPSIATDSGKFYMDSKEAKASSHATNTETAEKLWNISAELCKLQQ